MSLVISITTREGIVVALYLNRDRKKPGGVDGNSPRFFPVPFKSWIPWEHSLRFKYSATLGVLNEDGVFWVTRSNLRSVAVSATGELRCVVAHLKIPRAGAALSFATKASPKASDEKGCWPLTSSRSSTTLTPQAPILSTWAPACARASAA
jgi:hypothetical protein